MPRVYKILLRQGSGTPTAANWDAGEPAFDPTAGRLYVKGNSDMVEFAPASFINGQDGSAGGIITFAASDSGRLIRMTAGTVIAPTDATLNLPVGIQIWVYNSSSSAPTNLGGGVSYRGSTQGGVPPRGLALFFKIASNEWQVGKFFADTMTASVGILNIQNTLLSPSVQSSKYIITGNTSVSGTSLTLDSNTHNGVVLVFTSSSAVTVTIPSGLSSNFSASFVQQGTGQITFNAGTGVTRNSFGGATKTAGQYAIATLIATAADTFILGGQVTT